MPDEDPYLYPGTDVLRNNFGIKDATALREVEYALTRLRMREDPPVVSLTADGYRTLHKHIFQDVYDWAGTSRTIDLAKGSSFFAPARYLDKELDGCMAAVRNDERLKSSDINVFAEAAAMHMNEINARHPFREGNGRTQRALLEILANRAGHHLAVDRIDPARWNEASIAGFHAADHKPMQNVLSAAIKAPDRSDTLTSEHDARRDALRKELRKHATRRSRNDRER